MSKSEKEAAAKQTFTFRCEWTSKQSAKQTIEHLRCGLARCNMERRYYAYETGNIRFD